MQIITIYHNPKCSKSMQTLELIKEKGFNLVIIEYLKTSLNANQLKALRSHFTLDEFVRTNESIFTELGLTLNNEEQLMEAIVKHPILMQRPIVIYKDRAIIGRPPEKVLELFE